MGGAMTLGRGGKNTKRRVVAAGAGGAAGRDAKRSGTGVAEGRDDYPGRLALLERISTGILAALEPAVLLQAMIDGARELTGARLGCWGSCSGNVLRLRRVSFAIGIEAAAPGSDRLAVSREIPCDLLSATASLRLRHEHMLEHPGWGELAKDDPRWRGLLAARLTDLDDLPRGLIVLSDKEGHGEFTAVDEALLRQLALIASLALRHSEARSAVERERLRDAELRQALTEAESGNRLLQAIMRNINEGLIIAGGPPDFPIRMISSYCSAMTGKPEADLVGLPAGGHQDIWGVFLRDGLTRPSAEEMPLYRAGRLGLETENQEFVLRRFDGRNIPIIVNSVPIFDGRGAIAGAITSWRDISDLKEAQESLQQLAAELQRSNRDLEQFAYIASHDLQEPLRMVGGFVQLFRRKYEGLVDEQADRYIGFIAEGTNRMQHLIDGLLAYSRAGARECTTMAWAEAPEYLDAALANLRSGIEESGARITCDPLPRIYGDGVQLTQLFQNLIHNALKFTTRREPEIHVGVEPREEDWLFWVRDNGIGIDQKSLDRIFLIFQRLHCRNTFPGHGIGLSICKRIVEHHGGRIWVESQPGHGAAFYFTIPLRKEKGDECG